MIWFYVGENAVWLWYQPLQTSASALRLIMFTCRHLVALQSVDDEISSVYISFFLRWLSCKTPNTRCYDNGDYKRKQMLSTLTFLYYAEHCIHCVVLIRRTGIETKVTSIRVFIFFSLHWGGCVHTAALLGFPLTSDYSSLLWRGKCRVVLLFILKSTNISN